MSWKVIFLPEARAEINNLDGSPKDAVYKAIKKVQQNPLPRNEGGYGFPLGNKAGLNLVNCFKIKLRGSGIRVVYKLIRTETEMLIVVVGAREDNEVYEIAEKRIKNL
jgi:mRNA interferase RelE/StbE